MPTNYTDQFFSIDPFSPPPGGTTLVVQDLVLTDVNDDLDIQTTDGDTIGGIGIASQWPGDTVTINVPGVGNVTYTGMTFYLNNGDIVFTPTDGQVLQSGTFVSSSAVSTQGPLDVNDLTPACFTAGTDIATPSGPKAVETLQVGDLVDTLDHGPQPIRWIGTRRIVDREVCANPKLRPVRIPAGALGAGVPHRDLLVSRQHRLLVGSDIAKQMFDVQEVLVPAIKLVGTAGIDEVNSDGVVYVHLLFDRHEVIFGNGAPSESLLTGPMALTAVGPGARAEILTLFPEIEAEGRHEVARLLLDDGRGRRLAKQHAAGGTPFLSASVVKKLPRALVATSA